jgi:stress response protein SCP2/uncharacterized protein (AIM24 family)
VRSVVRGERVELATLGVRPRCEVGVTVRAPRLTVDVSCFGLDAAGRLADDRFFVFYNQPTAPADAVRLLAGRDGDDARFALSLDALPPTIDRLVFVASIDGTGTMRLIDGGHVRIGPPDGADAARFDLEPSAFTEERAVILAEVYRKGGWRLRAVGQGFQGGLAALVEHFGGTVDAPEPLPTAGPVVGRSVAEPPPTRRHPTAAGATPGPSGAPPPGATPARAAPPSGPPGPLDLPVILTKFSAPVEAERFSRPNPKLLRVRLGDPLMAAHGAMVAYQGFLDFAHQSAGSVGRRLAGRATGESLRLMAVYGQGECYLADRGRHVHVLYLEGEAISVSASDILAFDASIRHDLTLVKGVGALGAGLATIVLSGHGWVALTTRGTPLVLAVPPEGSFVDPDAIVAWSTHLSVGVHRSARLQIRGSGELVQLAFRGAGFVVVQPSER